MDVEVQSIARTVTLHITPGEAMQLVGDLSSLAGASYATRVLLGVLHAIRDGREYGGH